MFIKKKTIICFLYLKEEKLLLAKRIFKFINLKDLIKHFKWKYLAYIKEGD
jgi:hypothetical protein